jgi:hypothetical protein
MKYLLVFLMPVLLFAQSYPDKIVLSDGRVFEGEILRFEGERIRLKYGKKSESSVGLNAIDSLIIGEVGLVFTKDDGFVKDRNMVEQFVLRRSEVAVVAEGQLYQSEEKPTEWEEKKEEARLGLSFIYVPYAKIVTRSYYDGDGFSTYARQLLETSFETAFSYQLKEQVQIYGTFSVEGDFNKTKQKSFDIRKDSPQYSDSSAYKMDISSSVISIEAGIKYYFSEVREGKSIVYVQAGLGKNFGKYETNYEDLFYKPRSTTSQQTDNFDDYSTDLLSPYFIVVGVGAEYFINTSLSLAGNLKIKYESISAKYKRARSSSTYKSTDTINVDLSEINTRVGLGVVFYF